METLLRWLIMPALVVGFAGFVRGQDAGDPRKTGKVLLLKTGLVMEGDIEQQGNEMCIRRGSSELRIAVDRTLRLCPDWIDAYAFMLAHLKADNANDHVKLSRWCHANRLADQAMLHAKTALELQPNHGEAKQLLATLERMRQGPASKTIKTVAVAAPAPRAVEPPPAVDVSAATLVAFTSKVQPILMNTCVSCHANETGGKFRLERVYESGRSASSQRNLAAVLEHVDLERPTISTLLVKAITPHGREAGAPLKDRAGAPFQAIQQWIVDAVRTNPQLKEYRAARNPAPVKKTPEEKPSTFSSQGSLAPTGDDVSRPLERRAVKAAPQAQATRTPQTARERDWCHEDIFNEWAHPQRFAPQTAQAGTR